MSYNLAYFEIVDFFEYLLVAHNILNVAYSCIR